MCLVNSNGVKKTEYSVLVEQVPAKQKTQIPNNRSNDSKTTVN